MNEESNFRLVKDKPRSKKLNHRIDMTAMVSVSFLLIIFFMVAKELARPQSMSFGLGDRGCGSEPDGCCLLDHRRVLTLLLDDNNKIISYRGILEMPYEKPRILDYSKESIRKELMRSNKQIKKLTGRTERTIVIIKPSKKSNFGNLVDILDEMAITEIPIYAVVNDFTPEESKLLASK